MSAWAGPVLAKLAVRRLGIELQILNDFLMVTKFSSLWINPVKSLLSLSLPCLALLDTSAHCLCLRDPYLDLPTKFRNKKKGKKKPFPHSSLRYLTSVSQQETKPC